MIDITAVQSRSELRQFAILPRLLYKDYRGFCPNLDTENIKILRPDKNPFFAHAKARFFVARKNGQIVGRIGAIIDEGFIQQYKENTGYFGFFDCIHDIQVCQLLLQAAENWLKDNKMEKVIGPLSPSTAGEVGLMTSGFDEAPMLMMPFHPPYMMQMMEQLSAYKPIKNLYSYYYDVLKAPKIDRHQLTERFANYGDLKLRPFNMASMKSEINLLIDVYNDAWSNNWGFVPFTAAEIDHLGQSIKPLLIPDLIWFVELSGQPVGIILALPNLYQIISDFNGRLLPLNWLKLLWRLKVSYSITKGRLALFGVRKQYQRSRLGSFIAALLLEAIRENGKKLGFVSAELGWVLEDNSALNLLLKNIGGSYIYKTFRIYQKEILS